MHELDCPRCGRRPLDEFTFGGERRASADWLNDPGERDFDDVWVFENPAGIALKPQVPQPVVIRNPSTPVSPMIGLKSAEISQSPAHVRRIRIERRNGRSAVILYA